MRATEISSGPSELLLVKGMYVHAKLGVTKYLNLNWYGPSPRDLLGYEWYGG